MEDFKDSLQKKRRARNDFQMCGRCPPIFLFTKPFTNSRPVFFRATEKYPYTYNSTRLRFLYHKPNAPYSVNPDSYPPTRIKKIANIQIHVWW